MNAVVKPLPQARIIECTEKQYFRDPCEVPSLSQSIAHVLCTQSPLHAWTVHPRLGKEENETESDESKAQTPAAQSPGVYAWLVDFYSGYSSWGNHGYSGFVRAVRVGQSLAVGA